MNTNEQNSNDFVSNMDELQAEHVANKATAEAKAKAEQDAKWKVERIERNKVEAVARVKRNAERSITLRKIADKINLPNQSIHKAEVIEEDGKLIVDGFDVGYQLDFVQERSHQSSWRSSPNGKMRLTVGGFGSRTSFPQRKDGSHNYEEIARMLMSYAMKKNAEAVAADNRRGNTQKIANLAAELFPNDKNGYQDVVTASSSPEAPVRFRFKLDHALTSDQARALAAAIRAAGVKLYYND
jgi:hypothetical protein